MKTVRIGTRESKLAVAQANMVAKSITLWDPTIITEIITMKTLGDKLMNVPIESIGGKGVFVKELEFALINGKVDLCVHSLKDMQILENSKLPICAVSNREDPRDVLILPEDMTELDQTLPIGCSSLRRKIQLQKIYPGIKIESIRGNVLTRIDKLNTGKYGAIVLAAAGIKRLGLQKRIHTFFTDDQIVPACGQGIIAVQSRAGEKAAYLTGFHSANSWDMALAERAYMLTIGGGCTSASTAHATIKGDMLSIKGYAVSDNNKMVHGEFSGSRKNAATLGIQLAAYLKNEASLLK